jgi:hypothetical protein
MSIENTLASIDSSLQQIVTLLTEQQSASAEAQPSQEKKTRTRKSDTAPAVADEKKPDAPAATEQPTATTAPTATVQAAPASVPTSTTATPPQAASADTPWQTVLGAIQALNKSDKPGHGRDGVLAVLKQFGLEGKKVPQLEGLGKNAEVLAFVNSLLNAPASDDLGL